MRLTAATDARSTYGSTGGKMTKRESSPVNDSSVRARSPDGEIAMSGWSGG